MIKVIPTVLLKTKIKNTKFSAMKHYQNSCDDQSPVMQTLDEIGISLREIPSEICPLCPLPISDFFDAVFGQFDDIQSEVSSEAAWVETNIARQTRNFNLREN